MRERDPQSDSPGGTRVLAFATRERADLAAVRAYVEQAFPHARVTYLVPDSFPDPSGEGGGGCGEPAPRVGRVLKYAEGGVRSWPAKARTVLGLVLEPYDYCVFPMRFCYCLRLDVVAALPILVRAGALIILEPDGIAAEASTKAGFLARYVASYCALHYGRVRGWLSRFYREHLEGLVKEYVDPVCFLLLGVASLSRRRLWRLGQAGGGSASRCHAGARHARQGSRPVPAISYFISNLDVGGTQRQLHTLMSNVGGEVRLQGLFAFVHCESPYNEWFERLGVPVTVVRRRIDEQGLAPAGRFLWNNFPYTMSVLRLLGLLRRDGRPLILHNWEFKADCIGAIAAGLAGIPVILSSVRNMSHWKLVWDHAWWYRSADIITSRINDCVLANSDAVREDYRRWARLPRGRLMTVRNGLDPRSLGPRDEETGRRIKAELGWEQSIPVVGWVGRLSPQKDPYVFLELAGRLLEQGLTFRGVMIGAGALAARIEAMCRDKGLAGRVRLLGLRADVYHWMQAIDVLVMTSIIEGMPNVLMEAQFMGIPCVTTDAGGAGEVVEDGVTGFVVARGDIEALVVRTRRLIEDPSLRQRFGRAGTERARALFCAEAMVRRHLEVYRRLLEEKGF